MPRRLSPAEQEIQDYISAADQGLAGQSPKAQTMARSSDPRTAYAGQRMMQDRSTQNYRNNVALDRQTVRDAKAAEVEAKKQAAAAAKAARQTEARNVRAGAAQGMATVTNVETGRTSIKTDPTGKPVWETGAVGDPYKASTATQETAIPRPDGGVYRPLSNPLIPDDDSIVSTPGTAEKTVTENWMQDRRDAQGNVAPAPLPVKTDEKTGQQTVSKKNATGQTVESLVGVDPNIREKQNRIKAIQQRKDNIALATNQVKQAEAAYEPQFKPVEDAYKEADSKRKKYVDDGFERREVRTLSGSVSRWGKFNDDGIWKPLKDTEAADYQRNKDQAQQQFAIAEKAYNEAKPRMERIKAEAQRLDFENLRATEDDLRIKSGLGERDHVAELFAANPGGVTMDDFSKAAMKQLGIPEPDKEQLKRFKESMDSQDGSNPLTRKLAAMDIQGLRVQRDLSTGAITPEEADTKTKLLAEWKGQTIEQAKAEAASRLESQGREIAGRFIGTGVRSQELAGAKPGGYAGIKNEINEMGGFLTGNENIPELASQVLRLTGAQDLDKAITAAGKLSDSPRYSGETASAVVEHLTKLKSAFDTAGIKPEERPRYIRDAAKSQAWTAQDKDSLRQLSTGDLVINPGKIFGNKDAIISEINSAKASPEAKKSALSRLDRMRDAMSNSLFTQTVYADADFKEFAGAQMKAGNEDRAAILDQWAKQQKDRGWVFKATDAVTEGVKTGSVGIVKTIVGGAGGLSSMVGLDGIGGSLGKTASQMGELIQTEKDAAQLRGVTGGYGIASDLTDTVAQMAPMFAGGIAAQGLKSIAATATRGMSVYGWAGAQGYESKLADAVSMAQEQKGSSLTSNEVAEVLSSPRTQMAAFLNGTQTAMLAAVMPKGTERVALGTKAASMTVTDFLRAGGTRALKDGTLKSEIKAMGKTIFADATDEMLEEFTNQVFDGVISAGVLKQNVRLGDLLEQSAEAGALGAMAGGALPQLMAGQTKAERHKAMVSALQQQALGTPDQRMVSTALAAIDPEAQAPDAKELQKARQLVGADTQAIKGMEQLTAAYDAAMKAKDYTGAAKIEEDINRAFTEAQTNSAKDAADAVILSRELDALEEQTGNAVWQAQQELNAARASGDKQAVTQAEIALEEVRQQSPNAPLARAAVKLATGKDIGALTDSELRAVGYKPGKDGIVEPMAPKELANLGLSKPLIRRAADGSAVILDEAIQQVAATSERAAARIRLGEQEAMAAAQSRAQSPTPQSNAAQPQEQAPQAEAPAQPPAPVPQEPGTTGVRAEGQGVGGTPAEGQAPVTEEAAPPVNPPAAENAAPAPPAEAPAPIAEEPADPFDPTEDDAASLQREIEAEAVADEVAARVVAKLPGMKGRITVKGDRPIQNGKEIETGGLHAVGNEVVLTIPDIMREIEKANGDTDAVADSLERIALTHEIVHLIQFEAVHDAWKESGGKGTWAEFFNETYGRMAGELSEDVMTEARKIYGGKAWDQLSYVEKAAEVVRMLVESRLDPDAPDVSELFRAVRTANSPTFIDLLKRAVEKLVAMLKSGELPANVREEVDKIEALYRELTGETKEDTSQNASTNLDANETPVGETQAPEASTDETQAEAAAPAGNTPENRKKKANITRQLAAVQKKLTPYTPNEDPLAKKEAQLLKELRTLRGVDDIADGAQDLIDFSPERGKAEEDRSRFSRPMSEESPADRQARWMKRIGMENPAAPPQEETQQSQSTSLSETESSDITKGKWKPNHTVFQAISYPDYIPLGIIQVPHDGTVKGMGESWQTAMDEAERQFGDISNNGSFAGATDGTGRVTHVVRPNGTALKLGTPEGEYAKGNLNAFRDDALSRILKAKDEGDIEAANKIAQGEIDRLEAFKEARRKQDEILQGEVTTAKDGFKKGKKASDFDSRFDSNRDYLNHLASHQRYQLQSIADADAEIAKWESLLVKESASPQTSPKPRKPRSIDSPARREAWALIRDGETEYPILSKLIGSVGKIAPPPANFGLIRAKRKKKQKLTNTERALWDKFDGQYNGVLFKSDLPNTKDGKIAQELLGLAMGRQGEGMDPDQAAQGIKRDWTPDQLWQALRTELGRVAKGRKEHPMDPNRQSEPTAEEIAAAEAQNAGITDPETAQAQGERFDAANTADNGKPMSIEDFRPDMEGQYVTVDGERMYITNVEWNSFLEVADSVTLDDHTRFGRQVLEDGEVVYVEEEPGESPQAKAAKKPAPQSAMDRKNADSKELFGDDGGFKLGQDTTTDGAKIEAERKAKEEAKAAMDAAQGRLFSSPSKATDARYLELAKDPEKNAEELRSMVYAQMAAKGYDPAIADKLMHTAPSADAASEDGSSGVVSLANLKNSDLVPKDYWTRPDWYVSEASERESHRQIMRAMEGKKIRVYRTIPATSKDTKIRNGDWVTPSREYAIESGKDENAPTKVISTIARPEQLFWDGNSANELGFDDGKSYAYKNTKNNRKRTDLVTYEYDENGNASIIPLSKRFNYRNPSALFSSPSRDTTPDLFAAANAPDAKEKLGDVRAGKVHALNAYKMLTAKKAKVGLSKAEEQQLLEVEQALGQKLAFDMESVRGEATVNESLTVQPAAPAPQMRGAMGGQQDMMLGGETLRGGQMTLFSSPRATEAFFSQLSRTLEAKMPKSAPPAQVMQIAQSGAKAEEIKWSGLATWLQGRDKVDKAELLQWMSDEGTVRFEEVTLGENAESPKRWKVSDSNMTEYYSTEQEAEEAAKEWRYNILAYNDRRSIVPVGEGWEIVEGDTEYGREDPWMLYDNLGNPYKGFDTQEEAQEALDELNQQYAIQPLYDEYWISNSKDVYDSETEAEEARDEEDYESAGVEVEEADPEENPNASKFSQYTLPGGENYREVVLAMPKAHKPNTFENWYNLMYAKDGLAEPFADLTPERKALFQRQYEQTEKTSNKLPATEQNYTSGHFPDVPNYVAHMRLNERTDAEGKPGLFIEELQSDRHQAGRKEGYTDGKEDELPVGFSVKKIKVNGQDGYQVVADEDGRGMGQVYSTEKLATLNFVQSQREMGYVKGKIADAPFRTTWPLALFKRALRDAVAGNKSWIGWTVGETQNDRFDLSKQVDEVIWIRDDPEEGVSGGSPNGTLKAKKDGRIVISEITTPEKLADYIGKDVAERLVNAPVEKQNSNGHNVRRLSGVQLQVGGSGMKGFYDNMLPKEIGKYVKQWGGKVEQSNIGGSKASPEFNQWLDDLEKARAKYGLYSDEATAIATAGPKDSGFRALTPIWRVDITPAMKQGVEMGQPLFSSPSSAGAQDAAYLKAVESGDMETAQRMVDQAAKKAGYNVGPLFHGSPSSDIKTFQRGFWTSDKNRAAGYLNLKGQGNVYRAYLKINRPYKVHSENTGLFHKIGYEGKKGDFHDGAITDGTYDNPTVAVVVSPEQIKSADPVTYAANGNVIPLSQRFNPNIDSILFSSPSGNRRSDPILDLIRKLVTDPEKKAETWARANNLVADVRRRFDSNRLKKEMSKQGIDAARYTQIRDVAILEAVARALPPEIRGKLIGSFRRLNELKTEKGRENYILKLLPKIEQAMEGHLQKLYRADIRKTLKKGSSTSNSNRTRGGKITPEGHDVFDKARAAMTMTAKAAGADAAEIQAKLESSEPMEMDEIDSLDAQINALELFHEYEKADSARLEKALEFLKGIYSKGRQKWLWELKDRKDKRAARVAKLAQALGYDGTRASRNNLRRVDESLLTRLNEGLMGTTLSGSQIIRRLGEASNDADVRAILEEAEMAFTKAEGREIELNLADNEAFGEAMKKILEVKSEFALTSKLKDLSTNDSGPVPVTSLEFRKVSKINVPLSQVEELINREKSGFVPANGKTAVVLTDAQRFELEKQWELYTDLTEEQQKGIRTLPVSVVEAAGERRSLGAITQLEGLNLHLIMRQTDQAEKLEAMGYDEQTMTELEAWLEPEVKALGKWMVDYLAKDTKEVDKLHREEKGIGLKLVDQYFPVRNDVVNTDGSDIGLTGQAQQHTGRSLSFVKERIINSAEPLLGNALAVFLAHRAQVNFWKSHVEPMREWGGMFRDPRFAAAVKGTMGDRYYNSLTRRIERIEGGGKLKGGGITAMDRLVKSLLRRFSMGTLGWRLSTFMVNATAALNAGLTIPAPQLVKGMARAIKRPEAFKDAWNSPVIQRRLQTGATFEAMLAKAKGPSIRPVSSSLERMAEPGVNAINYIDTAANVVGAAAVWEYTRTEAVNAGVPEEEARKLADDAAELMFLRAAQPTMRFARSELELAALENPLSALFTLFLSEPRKNFAITYMAWREIFTGKGTQGRAMAAQTAIVSIGLLVAEEIIRNYFTAVFKADDDDEDTITERFIESISNPKKWAQLLATNHMRGIPVVGAAWNAVITQLVNLAPDEWGDDVKLFSATQNPMERSVIQAGKAASSLVGEDGMDANAAIDLVQSFGSAIPGGPLFSQLANVAETVKGAYDSNVSQKERMARMKARLGTFLNDWTKKNGKLGDDPMKKALRDAEVMDYLQRQMNTLQPADRAAYLDTLQGRISQDVQEMVSP